MKLECAGNFMMGLEAVGMCIQKKKDQGPGVHMCRLAADFWNGQVEVGSEILSR
jgi:hypothetical protein